MGRGFGMKGGHRPHRRRSYGGGGSGMKGYSRYGSIGKGLSDAATRMFASGISKTHGAGSTQLRDYVTFLNSAGQAIAIGSFQIIGESAASMGFGTGMLGYRVTGDTGLTGFEFLAKYTHAGYGVTGEKLYLPRETPTTPKGKEHRGMESASMARRLRNGKPAANASQFGAITTGRGKGMNRGYPAWVINMLSKANLAEQDEKGSKSSALPIGLALVVFKVLL